MVLHMNSQLSPKVVEDVSEMILNIKKVHLVCHSDTPKILEIRKDKAGPVTAADIVTRRHSRRFK